LHKIDSHFFMNIYMNIFFVMRNSKITFVLESPALL